MKKTVVFCTQLIVVGFYFFHAGLIYPQENANTITSIEIMGLRRTRPHIAMLPLERFIGMERSTFEQNEVFAVVQDMRVLNPISAELIETTDGLTLQVIIDVFERYMSGTIDGDMDKLAGLIGELLRGVNETVELLQIAPNKEKTLGKI